MIFLKQLKEEKILSVKYLIIIFFVSFVSLYITKDLPFFNILNKYITSIHEMFHVIATLLTGGTVINMKLGDFGGFVLSSGGNMLFISPAGYIGTALTGALLLYLSKNETSINLFLFSLGITSITILSIYIVEYDYYYFSALIVNILILLSIKIHYTRLVGIILSCFFLLDSFKDMSIYLFYRFKEKEWITDAEILAKHLNYDGIGFIIAIIFALITIFIYFIFILILIKELKKENNNPISTIKNNKLSEAENARNEIDKLLKKTN